MAIRDLTPDEWAKTVRSAGAGYASCTPAPDYSRIVASPTGHMMDAPSCCPDNPAEARYCRHCGKAMETAGEQLEKLMYVRAKTKQGVPMKEAFRQWHAGETASHRDGFVRQPRPVTETWETADTRWLDRCLAWARLAWVVMIAAACLVYAFL
jgi:hypothetical protein